MEKMTRMLAETFQQINSMCIEQIQSIKKQQPSNAILMDGIPEDQANIIDKLDENSQERDSESNSDSVKKQKKTKKIKKQFQKEHSPQYNEPVGEQNNERKEERCENKHRKKIKKVSHKPKAPASSFLLFFKEQQSGIAKTYPSYGVTQLTKVAAKCWNQLSLEEKQPYVKLCDQERRLYQERMTQYRKEFPEEIAEKEKDRQNIKKQKKAAQAQLIKDSPKKQKNQFLNQIVRSPLNNSLELVLEPQQKIKNEKDEFDKTFREIIQEVPEISQSQSEEQNQGDDDSLGVV